LEIRITKKETRSEHVTAIKSRYSQPAIPSSDQIKKKKSLGALRPNQNKTKPKSPLAIGELHFQRHTLEEIYRQLDEDSGEVVCNIAGWKNRDQQGQYLTVEISPKFVPYERRRPEPRMFDDIFNGGDE
jgi:hypothetical protein